MPAKVRIPLHDALPRERLESRLADSWRHRLTLVVAPAGSGKTTLVARFAAQAAVPVGWYRAETWDGDEGSFVRHLEAALGAALHGLPDGWQTVEDVAKALETRPAEAALLVVDDGHALEGTPAEAALGRLVDYAPPWLAIVVASRVPPSINLPRLRVSGDLLEIGQDDLRFRSWEVEQLFRDVYHDPVPPADLAALARRMEGWAAGLQLFHLATRGRPTEERRRVLVAADARGRLLREYLAQNVLVGLPDELRLFLMDTCVLGRLSGPLCDRLRGTTGSAELLDELARRSVFTVPVEDADDSYRYHEVLRSHLARIVVAQVGEVEARHRYGRAAELLESVGALPEALTAWCRAEDWSAVERLLDRGGERLANGSTAWLETLPPGLVHHDPWLALATARRARAEGRWTAALEWYARAEAGLGATTAAADCGRERVVLAAWLDPSAKPPAHWTGLVRAGLSREPLAAARDTAQLDDAVRPLARGLLLLAAGDVRGASRGLRAAIEREGLDPSLRAAASVGAGVADLLAGDSRAFATLGSAVEAAEQAGVPWLAAIARDIAQHLVGVDPVSDRADPSGGEADLEHVAGGDGWTIGLHALARAWIGTVNRTSAEADGAGEGDDPVRDAELAEASFRRLGSAVLEAWARGVGALAQARTGAVDAREQALAVEALGRLSGVAGARLLAYRALEAADPDRAADYRALAAGTETETGLSVPSRQPGDHVPAMFDRPGATGSPSAVANEPFAGSPTLRIGVLGGFVATLDGRPIDLEGVKPRARALLRLLALHAPAAVHREVLQEALWPEADASTGARSLQVAVSALRSQLGSLPGIDPARVVEREGDAYRLAVPAEAVDIRRFEQLLAAARALRARAAPSRDAFAAALERYTGDVLPEDGPAEWVLARRDRARLDAVEAALALAEESLAADDPGAAVHACKVGLTHDRYNDPLWRLLIVARERAGDTGAASRDRREYAAVLAGLGVAPSPSTVGV